MDSQPSSPPPAESVLCPALVASSTCSPRRWAWLLVLLLFIASSGAWLYAITNGVGGQFESVSANPAYIVVSTSTPVLFTAVISDSSLRKHDPLRVVLIRTDAAGTPIDVLGRMRNSSEKADTKLAGRTYTLQAPLNEPSVGPIYFRVAALFRSSLVPRGKDDDDDDWDEELRGLNDPRGRTPRRHRLPPILRKLQRYTLSDPIVVTVDPFKLPADPGDAGKQTLEGIDSDRDGVRDDVQRYIAYLPVSSPQVGQALSQYARAEQAFVISVTTVDRALQAVGPVNEANDCLYYLLGFEHSTESAHALRALLLNTRARTLAYLAVDAQLSGQVFPLVPIDPSVVCHF